MALSTHQLKGLESLWMLCLGSGYFCLRKPQAKNAGSVFHRHGGFTIVGLRRSFRPPDTQTLDLHRTKDPS
jgi:hypothetical protein